MLAEVTAKTVGRFFWHSVDSPHWN